MSNQHSELEKQSRDQRRKRILWEIGAWEKAEAPTQVDSFWGNRARTYWLAFHVAVFLLGRLALESAWGFNISIEKLAVVFLWAVILAEHWLYTSRNVRAHYLKSRKRESSDNNEQQTSAKAQSVRDDFDLNQTLRHSYSFIVFAHVVFLLVRVFSFSPYPAIFLSVLSIASALLGIAFHLITIYLRPDLRHAILRSKSEYTSAASAAELLKPTSEYVVSHDGELLEVEAAQDRRKR